MKVIITSSGNDVRSYFDMRFGRTAYLCVLNQDNGDIDFIKNENKEVGEGVGVKVAEFIIELGVTKVISGDFGIKAKELFDRFDIQMIVLEGTNLTIKDIVDKMQH